VRSQTRPVRALCGRHFIVGYSAIASGATTTLVRASGKPPMQTALREPSQLVLERAEAARSHDEAYLAAVSAREPLSGVSVEVRAQPGSPAEVILAVAEDTAAELIVLCSHGRSGVTRWALGSVAERVLHAAQVPMLIVRP
jgi:nucleotide-binding universal stress UspA family protein